MANTQLQLQTGFIDRLADAGVVPQRITDGYFNATAMCRSAGKKVSHYLSNGAARDFIQELSSDAGIPASGLVQVIKGGEPRLQGTWVHPQVAIHLAQWLSPKFTVLVSKWVMEWTSGNIRQPVASLSFAQVPGKYAKCTLRIFLDAERGNAVSYRPA